MKENKYSSLHLVRKYARMFVLGHIEFLEAHSFLRSFKTVRFSQRIKSVHKYFRANGGYCLCSVFLFAVVVSNIGGKRRVPKIPKGKAGFVKGTKKTV